MHYTTLGKSYIIHTFCGAQKRGEKAEGWSGGGLAFCSGGDLETIVELSKVKKEL